MHSSGPARCAGWLVVMGLGIALAAPADGQIFKRLKKTATDAAEDETMRQVERMVQGKIRCVFDDLECIRKAKESGEGSVLTDDEGDLLLDEKGKPVTDPAQGAAIAGGAEVPKPGEGAWANYDFQPGDRILIYEDFTADRVGDFPHRFDLIQGSWEIVDWENGRYLRATAGGLLAIPLPEKLPERFTVEFSLNLQHGNAWARLTTGRAFLGPARAFRGSAVSVEFTRAGLWPVNGVGPNARATLPVRLVKDGIVPVRVMADGDHMKVFVHEQRVANAPNTVFPRSDTLFLAVTSASEQAPIMIGPIRIAGGGRDLYDRLERDGRVATQGILFATNSDRIRPESTPTLEEIGAMLRSHPDLRIRIEGHTDGEGEEALNQDLSERRAAAVRSYLTATYGVGEARLEAAGLGESRPVGDNATPEGRQSNRRVELVRLES